MNIIPVLDLMNDQVVHAKHGERAHYQPIQSTLTVSSEPLAVVAALRSLYPFKQLYIADINAIQKTGSHQAVIQQISTAYPDLEIWLDAGFSTVAELHDRQQQQVRMVLGSESMPDIECYQVLVNACKNNPILSLDFKGKQSLGTPALSTSPSLWPQDVIVMTLDKVGSNSGPDTEKIAEIKHASAQTNIFAAGGVRNSADLITLKQAKVTGVLIASALHNGSLTPADLSNSQT